METCKYHEGMAKDVTETKLMVKFLFDDLAERKKKREEKKRRRSQVVSYITTTIISIAGVVLTAVSVYAALK